MLCIEGVAGGEGAKLEFGSLCAWGGQAIIQEVTKEVPVEVIKEVVREVPVEMVRIDSLFPLLVSVFSPSSLSVFIVNNPNHVQINRQRRILVALLVGHPSCF